jgi:hypothetical protein
LLYFSADIYAFVRKARKITLAQCRFANTFFHKIFILKQLQSNGKCFWNTIFIWKSGCSNCWFSEFRSWFFISGNTSVFQNTPHLIHDSQTFGIGKGMHINCLNSRKLCDIRQRMRSWIILFGNRNPKCLRR